MNVGQRHYVVNPQLVFSQAKEKKFLHALECEEHYKEIVKNATDIGMRVNPSQVTSFIQANSSTRIDSQDSFILLGFRFGNRPTVESPIEFIKKKFISRPWIICHLRSSGVPQGCF